MLISLDVIILNLGSAGVRPVATVTIMRPSFEKCCSRLGLWVGGIAGVDWVFLTSISIFMLCCPMLGPAGSCFCRCLLISL